MINDLLNDKIDDLAMNKRFPGSNKMSKQYVVMKKGFEYNDSTGETKGEKIYKDKSQAEATRLNAWNWVEICNLDRDELMVKWKKITGNDCPFDFDGYDFDGYDFNGYDFNIPDRLPQEQLEKISKLFDLEFYCIESVDSDE